MGQTITQKILAAHVGRESVRPGEFIIVRPDFLVAHRPCQRLPGLDEIGRIIDQTRPFQVGKELLLLVQVGRP